MAHVYASVESLKKTFVEGGTDYGTADDALLLTVLGSASRSIDAWCKRTGHGHGQPSGFGPVVATRYLDGPGGSHLELRDDLLSITGTISVAGAIGATAIAFTDETDFYKGPYGGSRYRHLDLHGSGYTSWYSTRRGVSVTGKWGYQDVRVTSTTTVASGLASDAAAQTFTTSASPTFEIGHTLLIGSEQLYVTGLSGTTATVVRGVNGTTAAVHANASAIDVYQYPDDIVQACRMAALRRWRTRDAGGYSNEMGGGGSPGSFSMLSDTPIFRSLLVAYTLRRV